VLEKGYRRLALDKFKLGELIGLISGIDIGEPDLCCRSPIAARHYRVGDELYPGAAGRGEETTAEEKDRANRRYADEAVDQSNELPLASTGQ
jgi:hypothetical protein